MILKMIINIEDSLENTDGVMRNISSKTYSLEIKIIQKLDF